MIAGSTDESDSRYLCYDIHPEDHWALCTGSDACDARFTGLPEVSRTLEDCPAPCLYQEAPTLPKPKPPHPGDIRLPGWQPAMSGACRGEADQTDKVNGKYTNIGGSGADGKLTQQECAKACLGEGPDCVGYAHSTAWCVMYGPGIHDTPGEGWTSDQHTATATTGTKPNPSYICVTGPHHAEKDTTGGVQIHTTSVQKSN